MTQEEILEYNKRCAEFLKGMTYIKTFPNSKFYKVDTSSFEKPMSKDLNSKINSFTVGEIFLSYTIDLEKLQFHSNWNWIMEIVEAIEKLPFVNVYFSKTSLGEYTIEINHETHSYNYQQNNKTIFIRGINKKETVIEAINQFLIWYAKNK